MRRLPAWTAVFLALSSCGGPYQTKSGLDVRFQGNDRVSDARLWDLVRREAQDFDQSGRESCLSDACFRIVHLYELEGREHSKADYVLEQGRLVFRIEEARYYALGKIRVDGAHEVHEA